MVIVQNALSTVLIVEDLLFQPKGESGDTRTVARQSAALATAIESGQLVLLEATPEPGDAFLLDEVIGTGVEQGIAHGLGAAPSDVAAAVTYVPSMDYGGDSAKPFEVTFGEHTDTEVLVTATSGVRFKLIVTP